MGMTDTPPDAWTTLYRWEWFRRDAWLPGFPYLSDSGQRTLRALADMMNEGERLLDCSCGFGHKTAALRRMGVDACGSDGCVFAVERAREIAASRGIQIPFFASGWAELPSRTERTFDVIFNDALCWLPTEEEFSASLRGIRETLRPGGRLLFAGARQGEPIGRGMELLSQSESGTPKFRIAWSHETEETLCTNLTVRELMEKAVDVHHLYLIRTQGRWRIETGTLREPYHWDWPVLEALFRKAGYSSLRTERFEGLGKDGVPLALNVAER